MINKLNWSETIFFFDIDDTLVDTASNSSLASDEVYRSIIPVIGEDKAFKVKGRFNQIFMILTHEHMASGEKDHGKYDKIIGRVNKLQQPVLEKYGAIKKWSREVFLKMAVEDCDINLPHETIYKAIDLYWNSISENSIPMLGVLELFKMIRSHGRPIFFITSSDARLKLNEKELFFYEPKYSEEFKRKRIEKLRDKGLFFNAVSIGDPEDKPHLDFFEKGIKIAEKNIGKKINPENILMFGDSYAGDLQTPREKLDFGMVVLYRKGQKRLIEESNRYISTGNIFYVKNYLK